MTRRWPADPTTYDDHLDLINPAHDRILIGLTERNRALDLIRATHALDQWASWARESSEVDLREGLALLDAECERLLERQRLARARQEGLENVRAAASQAEIDRLSHRLEEIGSARRHLNDLLGRLSDEVVVDSIELQRPLTRADGAVVRFVDVWVTLRVSYWRITRGTDFGDHERRVRYEGTNAQHLTRSFAIEIVTDMPSVGATLRHVRAIQAYARDAVPILVCPPSPYRELLTSQGVGVFEWTTMAVTAPEDSGVRPLRLGIKRYRRDATTGRQRTEDETVADPSVRRAPPSRPRARR